MTLRTRCADQGNGTYVNPILFGHYSDPTILRDGEDYYMILGEAVFWHSQDLVNWEPMYSLYDQLKKYDVQHPWAPDLAKHGDTYYYYAFANSKKHLLFVCTTKDIKNGPWSDPVIMGSAGFTEEGDELIDPAMTFDLNGKPYLFMSKNCVYPLSDDGLSYTGDFIQVADDPPVPDTHEIEGIYTEGPKLTYRNGYYYLMVAAGGTIGPATAHGVYAYRAKDIMGPWELSPYNPIVHTESNKETWWTKGHASFIDTPDGEWYILYHGVLKDYLEQGRMLLMEPIEWTEDGWFRVPAWVKTDAPLPMPKHGKKVEHGYPLCPDLTNSGLADQWSTPLSVEITDRFSFKNDGLHMTPQGDELNNSEPLLYSAGYISYEVEAEFKVSEGAGAGLTLFSAPHACCGIALKDGFIRCFDQDKPLLKKRFNLREWNSDTIFLKIKYVGNVASHWYSEDGINWTKLNICAYVAPYCAQAGLLSTFTEVQKIWLRPGVFSYGDKGEAVVKSFKVIPLDEGVK